MMKNQKIQTVELPENCVMTLKDVVDTINNGRGVKSGDKKFVQHGIAKKTIENMAETTEFGEVKPIMTSYTNNIGAVLPLETLALTKKQAIASGARLDNTMLMQVINRVEELESEKKQNLPALPNFEDPAEAAIAWAKEYKQKQLALATVAKRDETIKKKDLIITDVADLNIKAGEVLIGDFAKNLAIPELGQNNMFKWLKARGYLMDNRKPYQPYVNRGYFVERPTEEKYGGKVRYTTLLTPKGTAWLTRLIKADYELD